MVIRFPENRVYVIKCFRVLFPPIALQFDSGEVLQEKQFNCCFIMRAESTR